MSAPMRWIPLLVLLFAVTASASETTTSWRYVQRADEATALAHPELPITVQGRVVTAEEGLPLAYTNIFVPGTGRGTMAISDGRFWLRNLPAGHWTLKARYISYEEGEVEFDARPGDVIEIDFVLGIDPVLFDVFEVRAERKLLVVQETGTARRLSADQIENLPMDDLVEMVALQPGVVMEDNAIHIRGGRADDTQFIVDGVSVNDPLAAGRVGANFNEDLVNEIEVLTGGFSAEYGQAVSGVVNVSTKEGGDDFEGRLTYKTDELAPEENNYNTDQTRVTLSGPFIPWQAMKKAGLPLPGKQTFIVSGASNLTDTHLPTHSLTGPLRSTVVTDDFWSPRAQNEWSILGKLTWAFDAQKKLNMTYSNQQEISLGWFLPGEGYARKFQNLLDNYNVFTTQSIMTQANWRHVLGDDTYYEIVAGRQFSRMHSAKNGVEDFTLYEGPTSNRRLVGEATLFEGAYIDGDADRWHDHYAETYTLKADYAWIGDENNRLKMGMEYSASEVQLVDLAGVSDAPSGFLARSEDIFVAHPHVAAFYVQDRFSYNGLVLNAGLRLDAWAPGREVDKVMANPEDYIFIFEDEAKAYESKTTEVFGRRYKSRLSPRVGLSFPISTRDKFFFNYGHFSQWPRWNYVYSQLETDFTTQLRLLGNPDLDPKVTVQYETGIQHEFDNLWSAGVTFYSNDIYGYAQSVRLDEIEVKPEQTPDPNDTEVYKISPIRYFNADAARSLGIEFEVQKRTTRWVSGRASVEFQRSTGTNSESNKTFLSAQLGSTNPDFETEEGIRLLPLLWDRPWSTTFNVDVYVDQGPTPNLFGWQTPHNWNVNLLFRAWAGARYTERFIDQNGNIVDSRDTYAKIGPYRSALDIKFKKWWRLPKGQKFTIFLEGRNILDHSNWRRVNPWTGEPYYRGNWDGNVASARANGVPRDTENVYYEQDYVDPSYRQDPRMVLMGATYQW